MKPKAQLQAPSEWPHTYVCFGKVKSSFQTKHPEKDAGDEPQARERQHEDCDQLAARAHHLAPLLPLLHLLIEMPLDGKEHARAEHENLERHEDYWYPIHDFESFQAIT